MGSYIASIVDGQFRKFAYCQMLSELFNTYLVPLGNQCIEFDIGFSLSHDGLQASVVWCDDFSWHQLSIDIDLLVRGYINIYNVRSQRSIRRIAEYLFDL